MWTYILLALIVYLLYYFFIHDPRHDKSIKMLPFNFPYFGHVPTINYHKGNLMPWFTEQLIHKYDGRVYVRLPIPVPEPFLVVSDPKDIKHVLTENFQSYQFHLARKFITNEVFGNGIFLADGDLWSMQRNMAKPIFSKNSLKHMGEITQDHLSNLLEILHSTQKSGAIINIMECFKKFTLDAFVELAFGVKLNSLMKDIEFSSDFDWVQEAIEHRLYDPVWAFRYKYQYLDTVKRIDIFIYNMIGERRKEDYQHKSDFLSLLLQSQGVEGNNYEDKFIRDILLNFLIAGRDTTACLLTWCIHFLSNYPEEEKLVVEEIENLLGNQPPNFDNIDKLKYMKAFMDETLRVYPPAVSFAGRRAIKDDVLPSGAIVPKGTEVFYCPWITHRLPQYWGDDCDEFKPSRWEKPLKHLYQFVPFQRGPRICMGMDMAYMEAKIILTSLIQAKLRFKEVKGQDLRIKDYLPIILTPRNGLKVNVIKL